MLMDGAIGQRRGWIVGCVASRALSVGPHTDGCFIAVVAFTRSGCRRERPGVARSVVHGSDADAAGAFR